MQTKLNDDVQDTVTDRIVRGSVYPASVLKKISAMRGAVLIQDWTPDKMMKIGSDKSKWYPYLSIDKMKGNLNPLFVKYGLEVVISYEELTFRGAIGNMSQHVTLTMVADVIDIETGEYIRYRTQGEAGDSGDKALSKAQTYALKSWLSGTFMLADGFDPNFIDDSDVPEGFRQFNRKTPTEEVEMKSAVLDKGIKPVAPAAPAKPVKPVVKAEKPAEAPKAEVKPAEAPKVKKADTKLTPIQNSTMDKIMASCLKDVEDGVMTSGEYDAISLERAAVENQSDAVDFIAKYNRE